MNSWDHMEDEISSYACSDGSCVVRLPKGMATNGGCGCLGHRMTPQQVVRLRRVLFLRQQQVQELKAELVMVSDAMKSGRGDK